jgi:choline dehydrogenase-like flavoprotein
VRHTVHARQGVLLSAGALLSPQILMCSGIGPADHLQSVGVQPVHDLPGVGAHLQDHLDAVLVSDAPGLTQSFGLSLRGALNMGQGIWQWERKRQGILTTNFAEAGAFLRSSPEESRPDLQLHFVVAKLVDHGRQTVWGHGFSCHVCVLRPQSRGTVRLRSADPLTRPAIDPQFLSHDDDLQRTVRGVQLMRHVLAQPALARHGARELPASAAAQTPDEIAQWVRGHADTIYHPVGTCRMGPGAMDVVDSRLRVHGVQGLRVVDASIFPTLISGNTNAPTIMVAEKAAAMILEEAQVVVAA